MTAAELTALRANLREAWAALAMIREAVETLAPVGVVPAAEHLEGPTFMHEAEAIVAGIRAMVPDGYVVVPMADYARLLVAAESDDMIVTCETCGAWLDRDDPACATTEDYTGCWKIASARGDAEHCRSYRALLAAAPKAGGKG